MKSASAPVTIALTRENSKGFTKLIEVIGWTPDELANHLLAGPLLSAFLRDRSDKPADAI